MSLYCAAVISYEVSVLTQLAPSNFVAQSSQSKQGHLIGSLNAQLR